MSMIKQRLEKMCEIQRIMEEEFITIHEIRENWFKIKEYRNKYEEKENDNCIRY